MNNYTPAPWIIATNGTIEAKHFGLVGHLANCKTADARLIAAAPDLLKALQEACRCLEWHEQQHGVGMDRKAVKDARNAIAKALAQ